MHPGSGAFLSVPRFVGTLLECTMQPPHPLLSAGGLVRHAPTEWVWQEEGEENSIPDHFGEQLENSQGLGHVGKSIN